MGGKGDHLRVSGVEPTYMRDLDPKDCIRAVDSICRTRACAHKDPRNSGYITRLAGLIRIPESESESRHEKISEIL